jgi:hypothetical protein
METQTTKLSQPKVFEQPKHKLHSSKVFINYDEQENKRMSNTKHCYRLTIMFNSDLGFTEEELLAIRDRMYVDFIKSCDELTEMITLKTDL